MIPSSFRFSEKDLRQFYQRGISPEEVQRQIQIFKTGLPYLKLSGPCTLGDGIISPDPSEIARLAQVFEREMEKGRAMKFVPASGAASRMFAPLLNYFHTLEENPDAKTAMQAPAEVKRFFDHLKDFAFFNDLANVLLSQNEALKVLLEQQRYAEILSALLGEKGLNYAHTPKGLIKFHAYSGQGRTAFEEQLVEARQYCRDRNKKCRIHFTVSPEHLRMVEGCLKEVLGIYEAGGTGFELTFSTQKPSTDTIAVDLSDKPFRLRDGSILFRPGGHGSLLENLDQVRGDLIFIKNIDNVATEALQTTTYLYKKALGGILVELQDKVSSFLHALESDEVSEEIFERIQIFCAQDLGWRIPVEHIPRDPSAKVKFWFKRLNRPLRVCGMVPNQGEPGGGPYWVRMGDGSLAAQIVESAQVDLGNAEQEEIFKGATHFNPVDLVCGVRDYQGRPFTLQDYCDPLSGFISRKFYEGRELKALERPGLWNGGMAYWNTVFMEVPLATFSPVKTVYDLLRPEHQGGP